MEVRFLSSEHSPEIGDFTAGETRDVPEVIALTLIQRKQAEAVKTTKTAVKADKEA